MNDELKIALTGFMGVGKSSVARHLASLLRCRRVDLDRLLEVDEKRSIAQIIDSDGETIIKIDARLKAKNPSLFAVTIEKAGGVVVSGRGRIAALAKRET